MLHMEAFAKFAPLRNAHAAHPAGAFLFLQIFSKEEHICSFSRFKTEKEEHARP